MPKHKVLNLGCGNDYRSASDIEWINLDRGNCKVDISWDIQVCPYPFEDNEFSAILCTNVLEHISKDLFPTVVRELYRICKNGAEWHITVPAPNSENYYSDFTHKHQMGLRVFDFFDPEKPLRENGIIYGYEDISLTVLAAIDIENQPNGPDRFFRIKVNK